MKKLFLALALILAAGAAYYFTFGEAKLTKALKTRVDTQLQILQKNGFEIEDRNIEAKHEYFVLHYADPDKIARYFRSKNIDLSDQDADSLRGLKVAVDLNYLKGAYSALSADLYPIAFPPALVRVETEQGRNTLVRIAKEKLFLAHVDIDKLFTSYKGYLKDINETFKDIETLKIVSQGFRFSGTYNKHLLTSSTNSINKLSVTDGRNAGFVLKKLEGSYKQNGKTIYDFSSRHSIGTLLFRDEYGYGTTLNKLDLETKGESGKALASSSFGFHLASADIHERQGRHRLEEVNGKFSLENLSITALEKMEQLDTNDTAGFNQAFELLLSKGITLKMEDFSAKKLQNDSGKPVDGFSSNGFVKIDKVTDFKALKENPFLLLDIISAKIHVAFSDAFYLTLQKRPEFLIVSLLFTPLSQDNKQIFDIEYKHGSLMINGQKVL
jgi:hypothetical protein